MPIVLSMFRYLDKHGPPVNESFAAFCGYGKDEKRGDLTTLSREAGVVVSKGGKRVEVPNPYVQPNSPIPFRNR